MNIEALLKRKEFVVFALVVLVGVGLFIALVALRGPRQTESPASSTTSNESGKVTLQAKVMDQEYARSLAQRTYQDTSSGKIPVGAALAYREDVPLYPRPHEGRTNPVLLKVQPGQPASYLMESQVTGVRTNRDGTIWFIVAYKDGDTWVEMYAPTYYFQIVPGARNIPFFKDIKLIWEAPE